MSEEISRELGPILLTGATGRLGRFVLPMITGDREVRLLVHPGDPAVDELGRFESKLFRADLVDGPEVLIEATTRVEAVVHMAAQLPGPGITNEKLFDSIVAGTFNLLEALATEAPQTRLVYVSSSAVYGPQLPPLMDPITEDHRIRPTSVYGAAKAAAETMVDMARRRHGLRATIVRPSDIVVRHDIVSEDGFIGRRLGIDPDAGVLRVPVDETGKSTTMSFASASDVAAGIHRALASEAAVGQTYHIGPERSWSDLEVAEAIAERCGWKVEQVQPTNSIRRWVLDSRKALADIGFVATDDINRILRQGGEE